MNRESHYAELAEALESRIQIIGDRDFYAKDATGHLRALQLVSEKIEALVAQLPRPLASELEHYLQKRSYDKALGWIREGG